MNQDIIYWIGLTDFATEGKWRWQESHQEPAYLNWASGQPDNGVDEDCVTISGDPSYNGWHDVFCNIDFINEWQDSIHALCQRKSTEATTPTSPTTSTTAIETTTAFSINKHTYLDNSQFTNFR